LTKLFCNGIVQASPRSGELAKVFRARSTSRRTSPDVCCPQGRLMKLNRQDRPTWDRETLAKRPHDACGRPLKVASVILTSATSPPRCETASTAPLQHVIHLAWHRLHTDGPCLLSASARTANRSAIRPNERTNQIDQPVIKRGNNHEPEQPTYR
jgi:hypothetical protein